MQIMPTTTAAQPPTGAPVRPQTSNRSNGGDQGGAAIASTMPQASISSNAPPAAVLQRLQETVDEANRQPSVVASNLSFSIDEDSRRLVVKLIDNVTQDVIRQFPSEEFLRMSRALQQMQGMLIRDVA